MEAKWRPSETNLFVNTLVFWGGFVSVNFEEYQTIQTTQDPQATEQTRIRSSYPRVQYSQVPENPT